jgi:hypothetical protein
MVFESIFDLANSASKVTATAETEIFSYIQKQPNEAISSPPHDAKIKPGVPVPQDPKIVRETAPQAQALQNTQPPSTTRTRSWTQAHRS